MSRNGNTSDSLLSELLRFLKNCDNPSLKCTKHSNVFIMGSISLLSPGSYHIWSHHDFQSNTQFVQQQVNDNSQLDKFGKKCTPPNTNNRHKHTHFVRLEFSPVDIIKQECSVLAIPSSDRQRHLFPPQFKKSPLPGSVWFKAARMRLSATFRMNSKSMTDTHKATDSIILLKALQVPIRASHKHAVMSHMAVIGQKVNEAWVQVWVIDTPDSPGRLPTPWRHHQPNTFLPASRQETCEVLHNK